MIIKGKSRGNGAQLGKYLVTRGKNEHIRVIEVRGVSAEDVPGAVCEMDALSVGARTEKGLYHATINTPIDERLTDAQRAYAVDRLEAALGLAGQPRTVVVHEKKGREHCHVVWSRIDIDRMAAISDSNNFAKHEQVARELEREFGHRRVQGAHVEREGRERPERTPSHAEMLQSDRTGLSPKEAKAQVTESWRSTDSGRAFAAALEDNGWILARGDRRDFVVIDPTGGVHSLARRVEGAKAKDIRERMGDLDPSQFPNIEEAKGIQQDRARGVASGRDQQQWEDKLLAAGLSKAQQDEKNTLHISERLVAKDLAWHEKQAARPYTATERRLMDAYDASRNDQEFVDKLGKAGLSLAVATSNDLETLSLERAVAFSAARPVEQHARVAQLREGELVAINRYGDIRRLNPHKIDLAAMEDLVGTQGHDRRADITAIAEQLRLLDGVADVQIGQDVQHTRDGARGAVVDSGDAPARDPARREIGIDRIGERRVGGVARLAGDLKAPVDAGDRGADLRRRGGFRQRRLHGQILICDA